MTHDHTAPCRCWTTPARVHEGHCWAAALAKAETEGTTVSTVIRDALTAYTNP
jgi:hypothetical protein